VKEEDESITREKTIGSGLAGALAFLKDRGDLDAPVEWSGRTNDSKKVNIQVGWGGPAACSHAAHPASPSFP
jgi:hypothetical protein